MCEKAVEEDPWALRRLPDHFKTKEMCNKAVSKDTYALKFVPDWFVIQELIKIKHENDESCDDTGETVEWYDAHQKWKTQKAKVTEEFSHIAWYP